MRRVVSSHETKADTAWIARVYLKKESPAMPRNVRKRAGKKGENGGNVVAGTVGGARWSV